MGDAAAVIMIVLFWASMLILTSLGGGDSE